MVSPLCDDWAADVPYYWPEETADPFPPGSPHHQLGQQIAMASICKWDPTFLAAVPFKSRNPAADGQATTITADGVTRTQTIIHTPYGDLTEITENRQTAQTIKAMLETEDDYRRMTWVAGEQMEYDEDEAIRVGREQLAGVGQRGVLGTWWAPPLWVNHDEMHYHIADWPEVIDELRAANRQLMLKRMKTLRKAGYDYLFYCVAGTEWISPDFFRKHIMEDTRDIFRQWRADGGFVLWHTCGRAANFIEAGFYNDLSPEIFETICEPPLGNVPTLRWARQNLDRAIATKGNISLGTMLNGTEAEVRAEVARVKEQTRGYRHIVGLSDDLLHNTPLRNSRAFVDEARR